MIAVEEACEAISVYVDDLWKLGGQAYTEDRMKSLLDVIGNEVVELIQNYLAAVRWFRSSSGVVLFMIIYHYMWECEK